MADDAPVQSAELSAPSATEASNARMLNDVMGKLLSSLGSGSSAVVDILTAIAAAITSSIIGGTTGVTAERVLVAKGTSGFALEPTLATIDPSTGNFDTPGSISENGVPVAIVNQIVGASFTFKAPEDETVAIILNSAVQWTITQTNTITEAGTSTVAVKIGSTTLGGGANAASTSLNTVAHSSANVVNTTNQINVTFTSTSSDCENLCLTLWGTMVLA